MLFLLSGWLEHVDGTYAWFLKLTFYDSAYAIFLNLRFNNNNTKYFN